MFELRESYTRREIAAEFGGGLQSYLPTHGGRVVCGCFSLAKNPSAPSVVLPGRGRGRERTAALLAAQGGSIPVFVKRAAKEWVYRGRYEVERWSRDAEDIEQHRGDRADVTSVLWLRRVDAQELELVVAGFPPVKNEARSLLSELHGQRERVRALLAAAERAMPPGFRPCSTPVRIEVVVRRPRGSILADATNLLGGIGDVLQSKTGVVRATWLGELADVAVFENDGLIRRIEYREESAARPAYRIRVSGLEPVEKR